MAELTSQLSAALADRYRIERHVGDGGMATVYLAHDLKHDRQVALKVMRPELTAVLGRERFLRETRIAAKLNHPHILALYDADEADGVLYYVMPFVEGESLRQRLHREKRLSMEDALQITQDVGAALSYTHSLGVVHRDVKPENIMLLGGRALLTDFGIARAASGTEETRLTETGLALGTPVYMSPEQATAEHVDGRTDIYALGCVLYEMLGGDPPFTSSTAQGLIARKLSEQVPSLVVLRESVPVALEAAVNKALARDPADRFPTVEQFVEAASGAVTGAVSVSGAVTTIGVGFRLRRRWWMVAVPLALAAIAVPLVMRNDGDELAGRRVVVGLIRNETGDSTAGQIGAMAAQSISDGLARTGAMDVVSPLTASQAARVVSADLEAGRIVNPVAALAEATAAGMVVSGSYFQQGGELAFHLQVTDAARDSLLVTLQPVTGARDAPAEVVEELQARVAGVLALLFDERLVLPEGMALYAPLYAAYREFGGGLAVYQRREYTAAMPYFQRASALDSLFVTPRLFELLCLLRTDRIPMDSLVRRLERRYALLTDYEREWVAYFRAFVDVDYDAAYRAMARAAAMAPGSRAEVELGIAALASNRPAEAVEVLGRLDPQQAPLRGWMGYWDAMTQSLHLLGDYERELIAAREARRLHPDDMGALQLEARALAALHRVEDVERALDEAEALLPRADEVDRGEVARSQPDIWRIVGEELRNHGHRDAGLAAFQRALQWYDQLPEDVFGDPMANRFKGSSAYATWRGVLLYNAERPREAMAVLESLLERQLAASDTGAPGAQDRMGAVGVHWTESDIGVAAALAGDTARAEEALRWLETFRYPALGSFPQVEFLRARVAARLGRKEEAVRWLREASLQGRRSMFWVHAAIDFAPLHGDPEYEALLRPRG